MFGMADTITGDPSGILAFLPEPFNDTSFQGDQVRGFGFLHDGSTDTMFRFHGGNVFVRGAGNPGGFPIITDPSDPAKIAQEVAANIKLRRQVESFMLAFDTNLAPIVGQQVTLTATSGADAARRIDLLEARATASECDLVVHGFLGARSFGLLYEPRTGTFIPDTARGRALSDPALRALRNIGALTFTAVPPQSGRRIALDRDLDGVLNGDD
jgi:hypothetical protein